MIRFVMALCLVSSVALSAGPEDAGKTVPRVDPTGKACSWSKAKDAVTCPSGEGPVCIIDKYDGKTESGGWGCAPKK